MSRDTDKDTLLAMRFGTTEPPARSHPVSAGMLHAALEGGALRALRWGDVEILRGLDFLARDEYWGTFVPENPREDLTMDANAFCYVRDFGLADGGLDCRLVIDGDGDGTVIATCRVVANRAFDTRRVGFVLLHPIKDASGDVLHVTHSDGTSEDTAFPNQIAPSQPVFDIAGLAYRHDGIDIAIAFEGDVFEMEDHRNWTDASYKTYSRPIGWNAPYRIEAGEEVVQTITVTINEHAAAPANGEDAAVPSVSWLDENPDERMPALSLAVEDGWLPDEPQLGAIAKLGIGSLLMRTASDAINGLLGDVRPLQAALNASIDLEVIIPDDGDPDQELGCVADTCNEFGLRPDHLFALPRGFLANYQPDGDWPQGVDVDEACRAARRAFPDAQIGGGMLTNFIEFNRKRPPLDDCDYVSHGTNATIHAADDRSVMETLEALPAVFRSARIIAPDKPCRLGMLSIGMRTNPHGPLDRNDAQTRRPMALHDPRHRALFGAAWALGVVSATRGFGIETLALAAPCGPFGLVYRPGPVPQPFFDDDDQATVFPIYHLLRSLAPFTTARRATPRGLPDGIVGCAASSKERKALWFANTTPLEQKVILDRDVAVRVLDSGSFVAAARDVDWLETTPADATRSIVLEPYALAFGDLVGGAP